LPKSPGDIQGFACMITEGFLKITNSWFRPFLIYDSENIYEILASLENIVWITSILLALTSTIGKTPKNFETRLMRSQLIAFLIVIAQFEGNYGTSFRHKSFAYSLLLLITLSKIVTKQKLTIP
jgi:hypothetical protein